MTTTGTASAVEEDLTSSGVVVVAVVDDCDDDDDEDDDVRRKMATTALVRYVAEMRRKRTTKKLVDSARGWRGPWKTPTLTPPTMIRRRRTQNNLDDEGERNPPLRRGTPSFRRPGGSHTPNLHRFRG